MDALQRRKAEDNLIKMGINPFLNHHYSNNNGDNKSGVILMTGLIKIIQISYNLFIEKIIIIIVISMIR